ncbi:MAG: ABC transporter ATP-binding protein [Paludibacteraceae bacterium]|nr:ABC transporter ATP-binding protein [Paludibacteraceae bacterium]
MIQIKDFSYRYRKGKEMVFDHFNLELPTGHVYGLLGRNGVGKSTLIYSLMGLLQPRSGIVMVDEWHSKERRAEMLANCFLVPEEFELPKCTLKQYVKYTSPFYPDFSENDLYRNLRLFAMEGNPNLGALSMGQKKKVFMCFALACNTKYLIMDEPTNGLDIPSKEQFRQLVKCGMKENKTIIISTHQVGDIESLLDEVIILQRNQVVMKKSVEDICRALKFGVNDENPLYAQPFVGGNYTITKNDTGEMTAMRLELLFNAIEVNKEIVNYI